MNKCQCKPNCLKPALKSGYASGHHPNSRWNRGKTAESDERVARNADAMRVPHNMPPTWRANVAAANRTPEMKEKRRQIAFTSWANPEDRAAHMAGTSRLWADPVKAERIISAAQSDEAKRKRNESRTAYFATHPEVSLIRSKSTTLSWQNDEIRNRRVTGMRTKSNRERLRQNNIKRLMRGGNDAKRPRNTWAWVTTNKGGHIFCRSSWEIDFDKRCDECPAVLSFKAEPFVIRLPDGTVYVPDRLLTLASGERVLAEVKPKARWWRENVEKRHRLALKFRAARRFCRDLGIRFTVLDRRQFGKFFKGMCNHV